MLLQNTAAILLKMRRNFITKCFWFFITKCDSYYKMRRLLQIVTVHMIFILILFWRKCFISTKIQVQIYLKGWDANNTSFENFNKKHTQDTDTQSLFRWS